MADGKESVMAKGFKTGLLIGLGTGYVLGARAGRGRYEEIRAAWSRLSGSPAVQRAAEKTKEVAGDGAKKTLHAVQSGVGKAGTAVKDRLNKEPTAELQEELASDRSSGKPVGEDEPPTPGEAFSG